MFSLVSNLIFQYLIIETSFPEFEHLYLNHTHDTRQKKTFSRHEII